jgi:hypothetical protein
MVYIGTSGLTVRPPPFHFGKVTIFPNLEEWSVGDKGESYFLQTVIKTRDLKLSSFCLFKLTFLPKPQTFLSTSGTVTRGKWYSNEPSEGSVIGMLHCLVFVCFPSHTEYSVLNNYEVRLRYYIHLTFQPQVTDALWQ